MAKERLKAQFQTNEKYTYIPIWAISGYYGTNIDMYPFSIHTNRNKLTCKYAAYYRSEQDYYYLLEVSMVIAMCDYCISQKSFPPPPFRFPPALGNFCQGSFLKGKQNLVSLSLAIYHIIIVIPYSLSLFSISISSLPLYLICS